MREGGRKGVSERDRDFVRVWESGKEREREKKWEREIEWERGRK